jgi:outer membrane protein assembly factor BamB
LDGKHGVVLWDAREGGISDIEVINDLNGDGVEDILFIVSAFYGDGVSGYLWSACGKTGEEDLSGFVWPGLPFYIRIERYVDLDNDGVDEIILNGIREDGVEVLRCRAPNKDHQFWDISIPHIGWEGSIEVVDDVNGDEWPDIVVGTSNSIFCIDGEDGGKIWPPNELTGRAKAIDDINNDGVRDIMCYDAGKILHGKNGSEIHNFGPYDRPFPIQDVTGDGIWDIAILTEGGKILEVKDISNGNTIWERSTPKDFHFASPIFDVNEDEVPDVLAGTCTGDGYLYCLSGVDGEVVWAFLYGDEVSELACIVDDVNGNGYPDVLNATVRKVQCIEAKSSGTLHVEETEGDFPLDAVAVSGTQIDLSWEDIFPHEEGFMIYRCDLGSPTEDIEDMMKEVARISANTEEYQDKGLTPNTPYGYHVLAYNSEGILARSEFALVKTKDVDTEFTPYNNLFNPANGEKVSIRYLISEPEHIRIRIYDLNGEIVRELLDETRFGGEHWIEWDGRNEDGDVVASGVYIIRMEAGDFKRNEKIIVIK